MVLGIYVAPCSWRQPCSWRHPCSCRQTCYASNTAYLLVNLEFTKIVDAMTSNQIVSVQFNQSREISELYTAVVELGKNLNVFQPDPIHAHIRQHHVVASQEADQFITRTPLTTRWAPSAGIIANMD